MSLEMMDADCRFAECVGQRARDAGADEQSTGESGALRIRDRIEIPKRESRLRENRLRKGNNASHVVARRELGYDAAIRLVHRDLRMQCVGQQTAIAVVNGDTGFIAGSLETENAHSMGTTQTPSVYRPCPAASRLLYLWALQATD